jgi:hypothetical protein
MIMKTKLNKQWIKDHARKEMAAKRAILSSRCRTIIQAQSSRELELEYIANELCGIGIKELVVAELTQIPEPSEDDIASCVAEKLQFQSEKLAAFGQALTELSAQASGELQALRPDRTTA